MTNPMRGETQITLGTETYKARLTVDAIINIEEELDKGIIEIMTEIGDAKIRTSYLVVILRAALRGGGKDIDDSGVKKIISENPFTEVCRVIAELLASVLTDQGSEEKKEQAVT